MLKNRKYIVAGFVIILFLVTSFLFLNFKNPSQPSIIREGGNTNKELNTKLNSPVKKEAEQKPTIKNPSQPPLIRGGENAQNIQATLNVLDKTYKTNIKEGATVYDAMNNIQNVKENNFSYKVKEYSSLGIFVDEINGLRGGFGKYWLYYVNGKEASVGISLYVLKEGDIINWKQE